MTARLRWRQAGTCRYGARMTASDLQSLFVTNLVRHNSGDRRRWRLIVGDVRVYSLATHAHCNWAVTPSGSASEVDAVERLADRLREDHPIITAG